MLYKGGTVCDDYFNVTAADAVCIEMGYVRSERWESSNSYRSLQDSLEISLDDVRCRNSAWSSCTYTETHNCGHREDVYLTCSNSGLNKLNTFQMLQSTAIDYHRIKPFEDIAGPGCKI